MHRNSKPKSPPSGLDIDLGNRCSQIAYGWAKKTFANRSAGSGNPLPGSDGGFSSVMDFNGVRIGISSDGIGTKIELAERTGIYHTLGFDLVAMVADDLAANGIETVNLSNILDVDHLDAGIVDQLMRGLHDAAQFARITITGGEIAELGGRIGGYGEKMHFNWGATGIGMLEQGRDIVDGRAVQAGDAVLALQSRGFRSNGFSLLRRILQKEFGENWHTESYDATSTWGEILLTPSLIYTPLIADTLKAGIELRGIAHITGGGIPDNLSRVLKVNRLGAELNDIFEPLPVMRKVQEMGAISEEQAYRLWNMGNGMLLIVSAQAADAALAFINKNKNYRARICGSIIEKPLIRLQTRGNRPARLESRY